MNEIVELSALFFRKDFEVENEQAKEVLQGETVPTVLNAFVAKLESMETFDEPSILAAIKEVQKETGVKGKNLFMPNSCGYEWTNTRGRRSERRSNCLEENAALHTCKPHLLLLNKKLTERVNANCVNSFFVH